MILTKLQNEALEFMKQGKNIFITGQGGTGKTELINIFINWYKDQYPLFYKHRLAVTSTTGASALLIKGTTLHSFAGVGYGKDDADKLLFKVSSSFYKKKKWKNVRVLIIDEISMLNPELFDKLDYIARNIRRVNKPFGGIQLIFSGDFCQLPAVKSTDFCFESDKWNQSIDRIIYLKENLRQSDKVFQDILSKIRIRKCSDKTFKILESRLNYELKNDNGIKPTILYSRKDMVADTNNIELDKLIKQGNESHEYKGDIFVIPNQNTKISKEARSFLSDKIVKDVPVNNKSMLAVGCQVMLVANIDTENGLVNGSRGIITKFKNRVPVVKFVNGVEVEISTHSWTTEEENAIVEYKQIPLILGYAFTIHKAQGSSIDYVITDIGSSIFEYGQAYVALSRVRTLEGLSLSGLDKKVIKTHPKVKKFYKALEKDSDNK